MVRRGLSVVAALAVGALLGWLVLASGLRARQVTSGSMAPTYDPGSWVLTVERDPSAEDLDRGDVAVFRYPFGSDLRAVKRVVAVPGDRVELRPDAVIVNGRSIPVEPVGDGTDAGAAPVGDGDVVAPGHLFLLGDASSASIDSRSFGTLPDDELTGRVLIRLPAPPLVLAAAALAAVAALVTATRWLRHRHRPPEPD